MKISSSISSQVAQIEAIQKRGSCNIGRVAPNINFPLSLTRASDISTHFNKVSMHIRVMFLQGWRQEFSDGELTLSTGGRGGQNTNFRYYSTKSL